VASRWSRPRGKPIGHSLRHGESTAVDEEAASAAYRDHTGPTREDLQLTALMRDIDSRKPCRNSFRGRRRSRLARSSGRTSRQTDHRPRDDFLVCFCRARIRQGGTCHIGQVLRRPKVAITRSRPAASEARYARRQKTDESASRAGRGPVIQLERRLSAPATYERQLASSDTRETNKRGRVCRCLYGNLERENLVALDRRRNVRRYSTEANARMTVRRHHYPRSRRT